MTYCLRARSARSARFSIEVITGAQIEDVRFGVTPPAYTRLPDYTGPLPVHGLAGLAGTQVRVSIRSNRPLSGGELTYFHGEGSTASRMTPASAAGDTVAAT